MVRNKKIVGYEINNQINCFTDSEWKICPEDIKYLLTDERNRLQRLIDISNKTTSSKKKFNPAPGSNIKYGKILGEMREHKGKINMSIYNLQTTGKVVLTFKQKKSMRAISRGMVCGNYRRTDVLRFIKRILPTIPESDIPKNKTTTCMLIEYILRYYQSVQKNKKVWFLNITEKKIESG